MDAHYEKPEGYGLVLWYNGTIKESENHRSMPMKGRGSMKKIKNIQESYSVGFELGSKAHGFVGTDENGDVLFHAGRPVMGTRVFKEGQHAADARMPRSSRRRIQRKRGREREMERVFAPVITQIDQDFFIRRHMSYKLSKIRFDEDPAGFVHSQLFRSYPTLAHLDVALMESSLPMDPRLIFESITNHVVRRGHFLLDGQEVSSASSDIATQISDCVEAIGSYFDDVLDEHVIVDEKSLHAISGKMTPRELQRLVNSAVVASGDDLAPKAAKAQAKAVADLIAGYKSDLSCLTPDGGKLSKVSVADGDGLAAFFADECPDDLVPVLMAAQTLYTSWKLQGLLSLAPGKSLSHNQVAQYELYRRQLRRLKDLALKYVAKRDADGNVDADGFQKYVLFFGGPKRTDRYRYDKVLVKKQDSPKYNMGYTAYDLNVIGYEEFVKRVELLFKDTAVETNPAYIEMMDAFANHAFLRRIHTVDNGAIPYQLHVEIVNRIIDNQGRFYPWLVDARAHILKVLTSRIPYYVGPLDSTDHGKADGSGTRFAWVKRLDGHEDAFVSPWNYEEHIDTDVTAERFIRRMTGKCSYIEDEDVLPKNSLMYERFCFLNELAGLSFSEDGDTWLPLDAKMRAAVCKDAMNGKPMTVKRIESILSEQFYASHPHVRGTSNPKSMGSRFSNYAYFCNLFGTDRLSATESSAAEDLILWNTVFEDRDILRRKIEKTYGDVLDAEQIDKFCRKRLNGWGNLSERLLTGIWVDTAAGDMCILDILEHGKPYGRFRGSSMNLMQILNDTDLGFKEEIGKLNVSRLEMADGFDLNALPGSPALRRGVSQAMKVLDDIVSVAGKAPDRIYIKVTRTASWKQKGKRTVKRSDELKKLLKNLDAEVAESFDAEKLLRELAAFGEKEINERVNLYFRQAGKCLYSGRSIDLARIMTDEYCVDRILPAAYRKDESVDNKVLVYADESRYKTETQMIAPAIQRKMAPFWHRLRKSGFMSDRKLTALMRTEVSERMLKSIINRQVTEGSWETKLFTAAVAARYPGTVVVPVKAGVLGSVRYRLGIPRSLKANQLYHAHDALLAVEVGRYIERAAPVYSHNRIWYEKVMRDVRKAAEKNELYKSSQLDFFAGGFFTTRADDETGEVLWDSEMEKKRILRACGWKNPRVIHAPFEEGGAYWKQTVYSPRDKSKLIAMKTDRPAEIFGGYSSQTFANFFVYEVETKKGKQYRFGTVPTVIAAKSDPAAYGSMLEMHARSLAKSAKEGFIRIVRSRVLKNTVVSLYGERFRIAGGKQVYPVRQLPMSTDDLFLLKSVEALVDGEKPAPKSDVYQSAENLVSLWELILDLIPKNFPRLAAQLKLSSLKHPKDILATTVETQLAAVEHEIAETEIQIIEEANGLRNAANTKVLGGSAFGGSLVFTFNKVLNDPDAKVSFIDSTPAGLREKVEPLL